MSSQSTEPIPKTGITYKPVIFVSLRTCLIINYMYYDILQIYDLWFALFPLVRRI